jgi:hypothetical protein
MEQNSKYQICGPTTFNFYGFDDQITNITYVYNNSICGSHTIGSLTFQFIKIVSGRIGATTAFKTQDRCQIIYSSKVRTLMDAVYDWNRFNSLPRGYDWIKNVIKLEPSLASALIDTIDTSRYWLKRLNKSKLKLDFVNP